MIATGERGRATIAIGRVAVGIRTSDEAFLDLVEDRYAGFIDERRTPDYEFDVDLRPPSDTAADDDVRVYRRGRRWHLERGDFRAEGDPEVRRGRIRQSANPYSIDAVLRIVHTLVLAPQGGFLLHAASAIRNGRAFVFAGVSGAGKTTLSRVAPEDAFVLTDEISYVRPERDGYHAYGTPFAGELARSGENLRAPLAAVYLLAQGRENRIDRVGAADAARALLDNILFFAEDAELVQAVFRSALAFVERVPVRWLTFVPDARLGAHPVNGRRYVARATRVAARMIGDEMMIMSGLDSSLYSLNATASVLWQAADGVTPLEHIVERHICARFAVERDVALRDAEALIDDLARHGILRVSESPIDEASAPVKETR